jgi:hypothetical protein
MPGCLCTSGRAQPAPCPRWCCAHAHITFSSADDAQVILRDAAYTIIQCEWARIFTPYTDILRPPGDANYVGVSSANYVEDEPDQSLDESISLHPSGSKIPGPHTSADVSGPEAPTPEHDDASVDAEEDSLGLGEDGMPLAKRR